jgi:signal peptidase I
LYGRPTVHTTPETINEPRLPWVAVLLGFFLPPVAFAYVGRPFLGIALNALVLALLFGLGATGLVHSVAGAWSIYAIAISFALALLLVPWLSARASRLKYTPKWCNQWYAYALLAATAIPFAYVLLNKERYLEFATYRAPSGSMAPTIDVGDMFTADTRPATLLALKTNDVVIYRSHGNPNVHFVKRIVALPGQTVHIDAAGVKVDGVSEKRVAANGSDILPAQYMHYTAVTLGSDEFYMLGDNRENSTDSRTDGPIKRSNIVARAMTIFYSREPKRVGPIH